MTEQEGTDKIELNMWKERRETECPGRLFGIGPKEEEVLVYHAESEIHRTRKRPSL
jgi:hypothetical protein